MGYANANIQELNKFWIWTELGNLKRTLPHSKSILEYKKKKSKSFKDAVNDCCATSMIKSIYLIIIYIYIYIYTHTHTQQTEGLREVVVTIQQWY